MSDPSKFFAKLPSLPQQLNKTPKVFAKLPSMISLPPQLDNVLIESMQNNLRTIKYTVLLTR